MKVEQFENKNQFIIINDGKTYFQSYNSLIAVKYYDYDKGKNILRFGRDWDYSKTTLKHLYLFLQYYNWPIYLLIKDKQNKHKVLQQMICAGVIEYDEDMR